jgi:hypothetical protein
MNWKESMHIFTSLQLDYEILYLQINNFKKFKIYKQRMHTCTYAYVNKNVKKIVQWL